MYRSALYLALACLWISLSLNAQSEPFQHNLTEEKKPWTDKDFYNDPDNFQFAIVTDRTGGHRPGVFGKGLEKINMLYPEFVMSVGDLIEGYTRDTTVLNAEWKEFHGILDSLNHKFFYVAGNHDYTNPVMAQMWKEKFGRDYYHFIYKDVLFLIANSSDGNGGVVMSADQIAYLKKAIADNTNVRWTLLFLHHPMWSYGEMNGYNEVEAALQGRDYTVFAGHTHRYMFEVRNDKNHYLLATTGGGSGLRGPAFGEFDHIGWVTMTDEGPKLANLALSGVLSDDVSTRATREEAAGLIAAADLKPLVMSKGEERKVVLVLNNPSERELYFEGRLFHHHQLLPDSSAFSATIAPKSAHQLVIRTRPSGSGVPGPWDPLELDWKLGYQTGFMEPEFSLSGVEQIELAEPGEPLISLIEQDVFVGSMPLAASHAYGDSIELRYTADGTLPGVDSPVMPAEVLLKEDARLALTLTDGEGFSSGVLRKTFRRVDYRRGSRVRRPLPGVEFRYFEGAFKQLPDFARLGAPIKTGVSPDLDPEKIAARQDQYAIQYTGYFQVPEDGVYVFSLRSDDGSKFFIGDELIIDNDGSHDTRTLRGYAALRKGWHPVRIDYFEDYMGQRLSLWAGKVGERTMPVAFFHD